jgi:hypothetical protein
VAGALEFETFRTLGSLPTLSIGSIEESAKLAVRSLAAPGGHAAWTGLACAALFAIRNSRSRWFGWAPLSVVAGAVVLHATWDGLASDHGYLARRGRELLLLMTVTWYFHAPSAEPTPLTGISG